MSAEGTVDDGVAVQIGVGLVIVVGLEFIFCPQADASRQRISAINIKAKCGKEKLGKLLDFIRIFRGIERG